MYYFIPEVVSPHVYSRAGLELAQRYRSPILLCLFDDCWYSLVLSLSLHKVVQTTAADCNTEEAKLINCLFRQACGIFLFDRNPL